MLSARIEQIVDETVEARLRAELVAHPEWVALPTDAIVGIFQAGMTAGIAALAQAIGEPHV